MAPGVEELVEQQKEIFDKLISICTNYGKDGEHRKTRTYLENRIKLINETWETFVSNHTLLVKSGVTDIDYFQDDVYEKTKTMYERSLKDMIKRKAKFDKPPEGAEGETKPVTKKRFNFDDVVFNAPSKASGTEEKQEELLRQQYVNIRAFEHTVEKTYLENITEKWELEETLRNLKNKWEHIEKIHWELDYILEEGDSNYLEKYAVLENVYDQLRKQLNEKVHNNTYYQQTTPKIVIPDFYGNYNQWLTFKDLFVESVHNNPVLSKAQKMQYLKSKLKGEAERIVSHLGVSAENYISCWELLTNRYDNQNLLFNSFMNTLMNQPTIQQESAVNIRKFHDVINECLNGLRNIGVDVTSWGPMIVYLMVQKLDANSYSEYRRERKDPRGLPDLEEFINFLETKFMSLEPVQGDKIQKSFSSNRQQHTFKPMMSYAKQPHYNVNKNYYTPKGATHFSNAKSAPQMLWPWASSQLVSLSWLMS